MIKAILLFIISITLYFLAPDTYSFYYCLLLLIIFLLSSFWFLRHTFDGNYFNFHSLFLISYFCVNFIYPVFLYPQNKAYFPVFKLAFNEDIITRSTALALLGIISYFVGVVFTKKESAKGIKSNYEILSPKSLVFFFTFFSLFFFLLILLNSWRGIIHGQFGSTGQDNQYLLVLFQISYECALMVEMFNSREKFRGNFISFILNFNKPLLFIGALFTLLFFRVGDRGPVIQLILIFLVLYSTFIAKIKFRRFIFIVVIGMLVLTFISYARTKSTDLALKKNTISDYFNRGFSRMNLNSVFDLGMDLIINNRNLYVGVQYADDEGLSYGKNMFHYLFAPIPRLPIFMTKLFFNSTPTELSSGHIITTLSLGPKATYGLGTNLIADLYMSFGVPGVIFFMLFLGYFIRKIQIYSQSRYNFSALITYLIMISFSLYLPRASIFSPLRFILWAVFLYYFLRALIQSIIYDQSRFKSAISI
jgi:oligosaccharide repeat unit polymerase